MDESLVRLYEELKANFERTPCDAGKCNALVAQLKVKLIPFAFLSPDRVAERKREALLAREVLEMATLLSVRDVAAFEKNFAQLKLYYFDFGSVLPQSQRQWMLLGLNLLRLLSENDLARFHTELELIPQDMHDSLYIKQPRQMEQFIMEGSFARVWQARADVPHEAYVFFMDRLMDTIRQQVATTIAAAYDSLPTARAQQLLMLARPADLEAFVKTQEGWSLLDGRIVLQRAAESRAVLPATEIVRQAVGYAREMERIV